MLHFNFETHFPKTTINSNYSSKTLNHYFLFFNQIAKILFKSANFLFLFNNIKNRYYNFHNKEFNFFFLKKRSAKFNFFYDFEMDLKIFFINNNPIFIYDIFNTSKFKKLFLKKFSSFFFKKILKRVFANFYINSNFLKLQIKNKKII